MRSRILFLLTVAGFTVALAVYGLHRLTLGIDFTDEGAFVAMPLRILFGEKPFSSELMSLTRPIEAYLFWVFKIYPEMTLYQFRLLGWCCHLLSFVTLSTYLFRVSKAPLLSPLLASIPFFVCHIFGIAAPSYNSLSSDFLLIALCFRGLAFENDSVWKIPLHLGSGLALFVATFSHPALGLVAAAILARELTTHALLRNLANRKPSPSNVGALVFVGCWIAFAAYFVTTGAFSEWRQRLPLAASFTNAFAHPAAFLFGLVRYPFSASPVAVVVSSLAVVAIGVCRSLSVDEDDRNARRAIAALGLVLAVSLVATFSFEPTQLPICFAQASLIVAASVLIFGRRPFLVAPPELRFLLSMSVLGALLYATFTYFFSPYRSWVSGILALPFAFAVSLAHLLKAHPNSPRLLRALTSTSFALVLLCVAANHYRLIQRDAAPAELTHEFKIPKLQHIRSTEERVQALDSLYDYLRPKLASREPLLAFDDAAMLFFILDARPAYGLCRALTYAVAPKVLSQLDEELRSKPLPRYAVRTLVDLSHPIWHSAPRVTYHDYPLNETLVANYVLERTIFPFEVWRLKSVDP